MKYELRRSENKNILESWLAFSSMPPNPSVSIIIISIFSLEELLIVFFQSHNPFVHGFIVGPTWNPPFFWSSNTLLTKKLFPVLYFPTIETIPSYLSSGRFERNYYASWLSWKPCPSVYVMNGMAKVSLFFEFMIIKYQISNWFKNK